MNCFNHRDKPAIGLCKSCGKGLCGDCLKELPNRLACKGPCEKQADILSRVTESDAELKSSAARRRLWAVGVLSFWSGAYVVFAIGACVAAYFENENRPIAILALPTVVFAALAFGVLQWGVYELAVGIIRHRRKVRSLEIKHRTT